MIYFSRNGILVRLALCGDCKYFTPKKMNNSFYICKEECKTKYSYSSCSSCHKFEAKEYLKDAIIYSYNILFIDKDIEDSIHRSMYIKEFIEDNFR